MNDDWWWSGFEPLKRLNILAGKIWMNMEMPWDIMGIQWMMGIWHLFLRLKTLTQIDIEKGIYHDAPIKTQQTVVVSGWWLTYLPLVGNILLILMVNIDGWWFFATPLKNDGIRQLGWWHSHIVPEESIEGSTGQTRQIKSSTNFVKLFSWELNNKPCITGVIMYIYIYIHIVCT